MSGIRSLFSSFSIISCFVLSATAASAPAGNVGGTIRAKANASALAGAQIRIEGRQISAVSESAGRYLLLGVPAGPVKITTTYLGMEPVTQEVEIKAGTTISLDFELAPETVRTAVTVSAEPELVGQARALNDQKSSINLVNLIASDQMGSFPDPNAAEAIQRAPGIVVQRDQGEGRYVSVRGTEARLSATTINGERLGTTENTSRQIPLDTIPADLMGAIEVTKVMMPDMEADSIGGRVNLITKRATQGRHLALTLGSGFNTLVKQDLKDYNATFGDRLLSKKLGVLVSGNFYQNNRGSQDVEPVYTNLALTSLDMRDYTLTRTRVGGTWDVDYQFSPGTEIYFRGLRSRYEDSEYRHRLRDLISNGRIERLLRNRYHDSNQTAFNLGGMKTLPGSWLLQWHGSFSNAKLDTPYRLESTFRQTGVTFAPNVTTTFIDPNNVQANPQNQDLAKFNFIQNAIQNDRGAERNLSGAFDISAPTRLTSRMNGMLKFGLKVRDENRTRDLATASQSAPSSVKVLFADNLRSGYSPADSFLGGKYTEFGAAFPDPDKMLSISQGGTLNTNFSATADSGSYRAKERIIGGYVMDELYLGERLTLVPGIRFEATQTTYGAPQYRLGSSSSIQNRSYFLGNNDYLNVLPGIHLRYLLMKDTPLRVSFSRSLARPNYGDLAPYVLQDTSALTISRGNPNLKVTTSSNFDAAVEHYFWNVGVVSAGFFYKAPDNYIYATTSQEPVGTDLYRITQPVNGQDAHLYGFETSLVRDLDFLPKPLTGFNLYANYTHVKSDAILPRGEFVLPGQAKDMGNASLSYSRKGFFARVSWNFQGQYLMAVGNTTADDNWLDNRLQLDFSASQRINRHMRVFIDMLNLNNQPYRVYMGTADRFIQEERYKMWAIAGVKLDF